MGLSAAARRRAAGVLAALALVALAPAARASEPPCPKCTDSLAAGPEHIRIGLAGTLAPGGGLAGVTGCGGPLLFEGVVPPSVAALAGRPAWVNADCLGPDRVRAIGAHALGDSVVDLFVMGLCPFARSLEAAIAGELARKGAGPHPPLRLHFLHYAVDSAGVRIARSLHGPKERVENVVQMALQELEPARLWAYLAERSASDDDWGAIARHVGIGWRAQAEVERRIDRELDARTLAEWERVSNDWPHVDGSPTVFWLGREVRSINKVPGFEKVKVTEAQCPH